MSETTQTKSSYAGAGWIRASLGVQDMSPLGEAVANLLGDVFAGIYHLKTSTLRRVDWSNKHHIMYSLMWHSLSTVDFDELTRIVVLAHDRMIRVSIEAQAPKNLGLLFHLRHKREGMIEERCPTIEQHIAIIRSDYE